MKLYLNKGEYMFSVILALGYLPFLFAMYLTSSSAVFPIGWYWDTVSFIIVPLCPYFIVVGVTRKFNLDEEGIKLFGNLCLGCALIGTTIGIIAILIGQTTTEFSSSNLNLSYAIALITMLYGFIGKYLIAMPMIACKKNCK